MTEDDRLGHVGVTGAGFIGTALAVRLRKLGHDVRGIDLSDAPRERWDALGAELRRGDIADRRSMDEFCSGLDTVFHTAAVVEESGAFERFERVNVEGARVTAEAAKQAGVRRFVHFSSVMVHGFDYPDGIDETGPLDGADNPYCISKILAEEAVMALHEPGTFDVFLIRPGDVYGPESVPWVLRPLEAMRAGLWALIEPESQPLLNHVFVENLIDAVLLVLEHDRSGEPFNVTDRQRTTTIEFFGRLLAMLDIQAVPSLTAEEALKIRVNPETVRYLTRRGQYSAYKITELGYEPAVDLDEGMRRTEQWLLESGYLP